MRYGTSPRFGYKYSSEDKKRMDYNAMMTFAPKEEKRWCVNHPTAIWGKTPDGDWYQRCVQGNRNNEECEVGE